MKIKVFITTYDNPGDLNNLIGSLLNSDIGAQDRYEIHVINNHSNFRCDYENIKIYHNQTRPDFSTGHLARTWNQAIINGFKNIKRPDCDLLITFQDDVTVKKNWFSLLRPHIEKNSFMEVAGGDIMCIYKPDAIYNVGLWDERFCNIGYHEHDYFLRQLLYNKANISINDFCHNRVYNPIYQSTMAREIDNEYVTVPARNTQRQDNHCKSLAFHLHSEHMLTIKWNNAPFERGLACKPRIPSYFYYPYFEYNLNLSYLQSTQDFHIRG